MNIGLLIAALAIGVIAEDNRRRPYRNPNMGSISCHTTRTHRDSSDSDDDRHHRRSSSHCDIRPTSCKTSHHIRPTKCSEVVWCNSWWDEHNHCHTSKTCSTTVDCECDHWKKCNYKPGCNEWDNYWCRCFNTTCSTSHSVLPTSTNTNSVLPTSAAVTTSSSVNVLPTQAAVAVSSCPPCTTVTVKMQMPLVCNTVVICNPLYSNCPRPSGTRTLTLAQPSSSS